MSALGLLEIKPLPMSTRAVFSVLFEIVHESFGQISVT